jgi:hypothetical protein
MRFALETLFVTPRAHSGCNPLEYWVLTLEGGFLPGQFRILGAKKTSPRLRGEAGFWSDVPVFRALQPWKTLQFYQGWL